MLKLQLSSSPNKDLTEFQYRGDEKQSDRDLKNLKSQGLIRQKTLPGTEKEPLLTLSREAHEFLDRNHPQDVHGIRLYITAS